MYIYICIYPAESGEAMPSVLQRIDLVTQTHRFSHRWDHSQGAQAITSKCGLHRTTGEASGSGYRTVGPRKKIDKYRKVSCLRLVMILQYFTSLSFGWAFL